MKRRVIIYLASFSLLMLFAPVVNFFSTPNIETIKWQRKEFLYNVDFISKYIARFLYPFGISMDPNQVIIGRDGWLYLGDQYEHTRSVDRHPPTDADIAIGKQIGEAVQAWDIYLASKGVKLFKIMIGPNKGTIYPEHLPHWAKPISPTVTDALLSGTRTQYYVDFREVLLAAKATATEPLYYKTDTHWNYFGAGIVFQNFAQQIRCAAPEIKWPPETAYKILRVDPRGGGDLSKFLQLERSLSDTEPIIAALNLPIETTHYDFDTNQVIRQGGNQQVGPPIRPLLVKSKNALNNKKVLWLRDSFGTAISPLMAATFSDVVQLHWSEAIKPNGRLIDLVDEWNPDYVFFTVVERSSRNPNFAVYPPPVLIPKESIFQAVHTAIPVASNHLIFDHSNFEYNVGGNDPFIDFAFPLAVSLREVPYLCIDVTCNDGSQHVPLQVFWLEDGRAYFDEEHSVKFSLPTGGTLIDLRTIPRLGSAGAIIRLRVDIDDQRTCQKFRMGHLLLGRN